MSLGLSPQQGNRRTPAPCWLTGGSSYWRRERNSAYRERRQVEDGSQGVAEARTADGRINEASAVDKAGRGLERTVVGSGALGWEGVREREEREVGKQKVSRS